MMTMQSMMTRTGNLRIHVEVMNKIVNSAASILAEAVPLIVAAIVLPNCSYYDFVVTQLLQIRIVNNR